MLIALAITRLGIGMRMETYNFSFLVKCKNGAGLLDAELPRAEYGGDVVLVGTFAFISSYMSSPHRGEQHFMESLRIVDVRGGGA